MSCFFFCIWEGYFIYIYVFFLKGEKIYIEDLKDVLKNMGIEIINKEYKKLVKILLVFGKYLSVFYFIDV